MLSIAERYAIHLINNGEIDVAYAYLTQLKAIAGNGSLKFAAKEVSIDFFFRKKSRFRALLRSTGMSAFKYLMHIYAEYWMTEVLRTANSKLKSDINCCQTYTSSFAESPSQEASLILDRIKHRQYVKEHLGDI